MSKKIITIIGARPQIIKASALSRAIKNSFSNEIKEIIVHTGQHYDDNMSEQFFKELNIPYPAYNLHVGSNTHGAQTAVMIEGLERIFEKEEPDAVVIYGDTNSTIAGAIAASKMHIPIVHIEAGLRSFNKKMPEEINRITADHVSTLLFSPTKAGIDNLAKEGLIDSKVSKATIDAPKVFHCGDIMYDNSLYFSHDEQDEADFLYKNDLKKGEFILCTIHRDINTDYPENLTAIFKGLLEIQKRSNQKIVIPLHPRTRGKLKDLLIFDEVKDNDQMVIMDPVGFLDVIALEKNCTMVVTDSGGLQKEAYFFKKPCVILRAQTEWVEIVENGNAILAYCDTDKIINAYLTLSSKSDFTYPDFFGDGKAAEFICQQIINCL